MDTPKNKKQKKETPPQKADLVQKNAEPFQQKSEPVVEKMDPAAEKNAEKNGAVVQKEPIAETDPAAQQSKSAAQKSGTATKPVGSDFFENKWKDSWTYIRTVVDVMREPILILDKNLTVKAANEPFYQTFHTLRENTENKNIYSLGNGQWDIPTLRKLLEDILPKHTFFNGFQVAHDFPKIGRKVMILNGRQIYSVDGKALFPPIILLAMEDVTGMMDVAEKLARHTNEFENELKGRTQSYEAEISALKKEIDALKKKS